MIDSEVEVNGCMKDSSVQAIGHTLTNVFMYFSRCPRYPTPTKTGIWPVTCYGGRWSYLYTNLGLVSVLPPSGSPKVDNLRIMG